jgi:hypothetical protein
MVSLAVLALVGLGAAIRLPTSRGQDRAPDELVATHGLETATEHG